MSRSLLYSVRRRNNDNSTHAHSRQKTPKSVLLSKYSGRYVWLNDERFMRDLESDSVDIDILDEELRLLDEQEPKTCRGKILKFLESGAFQTVLCILVLLDAAIVISEILMDLHATRGQYREAASDITKAVHFLQSEYALDSLNTHNIRTILEHLKSQSIRNSTRCNVHLQRNSLQNSPQVNVSNTLNNVFMPREDGLVHYKMSSDVLTAAHTLHYCSIAILGMFVIQLALKIFALGFSFFKLKLEMFDGVVIITSFAMDIIFLDGIESTQGEEAAALLVVFLLWRVLRVINGIMVTSKKRQEFRIKLQKRTRRRAERKVDSLEDDKSIKNKEIMTLKELCISKGATRLEISSCKPKRKVIQKRDAATGLSAIASLSLGLSMSMIGGTIERGSLDDESNISEGKDDRKISWINRKVSVGQQSSVSISSAGQSMPSRCAARLGLWSRSLVSQLSSMDESRDSESELEDIERGADRAEDGSTEICGEKGGYIGVGRVEERTAERVTEHCRDINTDKVGDKYSGCSIDGGTSNIPEVISKASPISQAKRSFSGRNVSDCKYKNIPPLSTRSTIPTTTYYQSPTAATPYLTSKPISTNSCVRSPLSQCIKREVDEDIEASQPLFPSPSELSSKYEQICSPLVLTKDKSRHQHMPIISSSVKRQTAFDSEISNDMMSSNNEHENDVIV